MIIGLTGTIASGKGTFSNYLKEKGFNYITLSDLVREEARKKRLQIQREILQDIGNSMREKYGKGYWAKKAIEKIDIGENWIIDGIRNIGEVDEIRKVNGSVIIGIDAPEDIRLRRVKKRNKSKEEGRKDSDPKAIEEMKRLEKRDRGFHEPEHGQQVLKCLELANFKIINDSSLEEFYEKIDELLRKIQK
ncbi:dephospho-CoA kinase [Candidatus Woesearchaeota archaeon]|nr:dephospho-CoA kinase [Candidatus Woesearchaeota archaeon]